LAGRQKEDPISAIPASEDGAVSDSDAIAMASTTIVSADDPQDGMIEEITTSGAPAESPSVDGASNDGDDDDAGAPEVGESTTTAPLSGTDQEHAVANGKASEGAEIENAEEEDMVLEPNDAPSEAMQTTSVSPLGAANGQEGAPEEPLHEDQDDEDAKLEDITADGVEDEKADDEDAKLEDITADGVEDETADKEDSEFDEDNTDNVKDDVGDAGATPAPTPAVEGTTQTPTAPREPQCCLCGTKGKHSGLHTWSASGSCGSCGGDVAWKATPRKSECRTTRQFPAQVSDKCQKKCDGSPDKYCSISCTCLQDCIEMAPDYKTPVA